MHGREGENPKLCTLFFCCARLMSAPFLPLFIFDGPKCPKVKHGKRISERKYWLINSMKEIIEVFGFKWRMAAPLKAPGEAEAELAHLNSIGVINTVLSDDIDNFLSGAKMVIRSKHTMKNVDGCVDDNHSTVYTSADILMHPSIQLTRGGFILIGLLSGGNYYTGLPHCGPATTHGLASATQSLTRNELHNFFITWCRDLHSELHTNSCGHLS
ncbi:PIN domain-like protein [Lactarius deliciosus]|nr:PIN domain-like protein [Lactarius deliciosus]